MLGTPATGDKVTTLPFNAKHTLALGPAVPTIVIKKKKIFRVWGRNDGSAGDVFAFSLS